MAMVLTPRLANSPPSAAVLPSSVVHTGVKSAGWENRTTHESPAHSWKRIVPAVDSWTKSGAVSPRRKVLMVLPSSKTDLNCGELVIKEQRILRCLLITSASKQGAELARCLQQQGQEVFLQQPRLQPLARCDHVQGRHRAPFHVP